jgi:hypothetical protein
MGGSLILVNRHPEVIVYGKYWVDLLLSFYGQGGESLTLKHPVESC